MPISKSENRADERAKNAKLSQAANLKALVLFYFFSACLRRTFKNVKSALRRKTKLRKIPGRFAKQRQNSAFFLQKRKRKANFTFRPPNVLRAMGLEQTINPRTSNPFFSPNQFPPF